MTNKKRLTVYDIKRSVEANDDSKFFTKANLNYWGQTMKDFKVKKVAPGFYFLTAPLRLRDMVIGRVEAFYHEGDKKITSYTNRFN